MAQERHKNLDKNMKIDEPKVISEIRGLSPSKGQYNLDDVEFDYKSSPSK